MQQGHLKNAVGKEQILEESSINYVENSEVPPSFLHSCHFLLSVLESKLRTVNLSDLSSQEEGSKVDNFYFLIGKTSLSELFQL